MKKLILFFMPIFCFAQEHARILEHTISYDISNNENVDVDEYFKIKVNSEKANFRDYEGYLDKFHNVSDVTIRISDESGKRMRTLHKVNGQVYGFNPSYEISDAKVLVIPFDFQTYPYILEISVKTQLRGFVSLPTWIPRDKFHLGVDHSKLTVTRSSDLIIKFKEVNITGKEVTEGKKIITTYEVANLPSVDSKVRYQDFYNEQPKVLISPQKFRLDNVDGNAESWATFGDWFLSLNNVSYKLSDKTKEYIQSLDKGDLQAFVRELYTYMQNKTRYVSIQLGIGGFKSLPTEDVEKFGYGDCKALSSYMKNMLDFAGIKSNYILVHAGADVPDVISDFPSSQFNHVFIGVPNKSDTIYLECTSQTVPAGYTGTFTDDRNVLWIDKNRSRIVRSRVYSHRDNQENSVVNVALDGEGNSTIAYDVENKGVFFDEIKIYQSAPNDYVTKHNLEKFAYGDFSINDFSYSQPDKNIPSFKAAYVLKVKGLAKLAGTRLLLPGVPAIPLRKYVTQDEMMKFAAIKRGVTITDEIEVNLPADLWIYNLPGKESVTTDFGSYTLTTEMDGSKIKIKRTIVLYRGDYTKEDYDGFRKFYQQIEKIETRKLVLNSKT